MTFEELGVSAPICQAVRELGYEQPMPVQEAVIPYLLGAPIDLIALAQTGTGKTAAFGLPLLQNVERSLQAQPNDGVATPRALVLCPTRELCLQIADDLTAYSKYLPSVRILPVYGGSSIEAQIRTLRRGVEVIVATPGRLIDLMERGAASLDSIETVVLDEADEMLTMGFSESLQTILAEVPKERHLLLFSATMPREISSIAASYMHQPKEIIVGTKNEGNKNIRHYYYVVSARHKYLALKRIADYYPDIYGIIFCRTRRETQEIADQLIRDGYNADALHGELSQAQRDYVMQKFRIRNLQLLVATDVAARGLDVNDLTHVIHYGLPDDIESYTHRSGRTARAGKMGISIAICHSRERGRLRDIERISHATIERKHLPTGQAICEKQLFHLADRIERVELTEDTTLDTVLPELVRKLDWIDREELVRRLMLLEHRRLLDYYESEETIEEADDKGRLSGEGKEGKKRDKRNAVAEEGMKRLFINFGKLDRMFPNKLIELINKCVPGRVKIGKIDLLPRFAFFEVEEADAQEVIRSMSSYEVDGRRIAVDYADAMGSGDGKKERHSRRNPDFAPERKSYRKGSKSSEGAFDKYKGGKSSKGGKKKNRW
ncbi:DEAD/DEAH box helicase [Porphyromonas sp. oral taxon 279 str. F0450]|uniref:DEAD/DEAH box helicase n=1 Tax=Porphyromonas sp. oral taxon 279 TaxID=712438 RepID=UPI00027C61D7|nr:DEAD/DEAH box helicase [Porphyromonas sp. oral taxon 279]EJU16770.1 DEAD/DEAH box helicase [Porphyromonas sp. oral taxon 279 str. F0450]